MQCNKNNKQDWRMQQLVEAGHTVLGASSFLMGAN